MTGARRILSWTLLGVLVLGPLGFGLARLWQATERAALLRETEEMTAEVARMRAARLPALRAEATRLARVPPTAAQDWRARTADRAVLDMQETVRALFTEAGLALERVAPAPSEPDGTRIALTLRARGSLAALQLALYRLETATPRIVVGTLRLSPLPTAGQAGFGSGSGTGSGTGPESGPDDLQVTLSLVGVFEARAD